MPPTRDPQPASTFDGGRWRHAPQQPFALPDWMRDPPPARRTLGARVASAVDALPGVRRLRERRWARSKRPKLYQRYPHTVRIVSFFLCWAAALLLVLAVYGLHALI